MRIHAARKDLSLDVAGWSSMPVVRSYVTAIVSKGAGLAIISDWHHSFLRKAEGEVSRSLSGKRAPACHVCGKMVAPHGSLGTFSPSCLHFGWEDFMI
jgi:hypothetical protein